MAIAFHGLNRLLNNLRESNHDFKASTEIFPQLDAEHVEREMRLAEIGESRGKQNQPGKTAKSYDDIELDIIGRVQEAKNTAHHNLEDQLHLFTERLSSLDFQGQFSDIEKANAESISDFKAEVVKGRGVLHGLRRDLNTADKELSDFQKRHRITRAPRGAEGSGMFFKVALLVLFFFGEWIANGFFLSKGSEMGFVGGIVEALVFSFLNIGGTLALTLFGVVLLTHRSIGFKFFGLMSLTAYACFAVTLNLVLAHYREIAGTLVDGAGLQAFQRFRENPFGLDDLNSWMLFGTGVLLSVLTMIDGLYMRDPYVGYWGVNKRRAEAEETYLNTQSELIDTLIQVRGDHHEKVDTVIEQLSIRRREHNAIIAHRSKMLALFTQYQEHLERVANQLIRKYRDANIAVRETPAPKYFDNPYKLERIKPTKPTNAEMTDKDIAAAIRKAQDNLSVQIKTIATACDEGIDQFRELDNLFPEAANG